MPIFQYRHWVSAILRRSLGSSFIQRILHRINARKLSKRTIIYVVYNITKRDEAYNYLVLKHVPLNQIPPTPYCWLQNLLTIPRYAFLTSQSWKCDVEITRELHALGIYLHYLIFYSWPLADFKISFSKNWNIVSTYSI